MTNATKAAASLALAVSFSSIAFGQVLPIYKANNVRAYGASPNAAIYTQMDGDSFSLVHSGGTVDTSWNGTTLNMDFDGTSAFLSGTATRWTWKAPFRISNGSTAADYTALGISADPDGDDIEFFYDTTTDNRWEATAPIYATRFDIGTGYFDDSGDAVTLTLESAVRATFDADGFTFTEPTTIDNVLIYTPTTDVRRFSFEPSTPTTIYFNTYIDSGGGDPYHELSHRLIVNGSGASGGGSQGLSLDGVSILFGEDANTQILLDGGDGLDIPGTLEVDNSLNISGNTSADGLSVDSTLVIDGTRALKNVTTGGFGGSVTATLNSDATIGFIATNNSAGTSAEMGLRANNGTVNIAPITLAGTGHASYPSDTLLRSGTGQQMVALVGTSEAWTLDTSANMLVENALTVNDAAGASGDFVVKAQTSGNAFFVDASAAASSFIGQLTVNSGAIAAGDLVVNKQTSGELARFDASASTVAIGGIVTTTHSGIATVVPPSAFVISPLSSDPPTFSAAYYWLTTDGLETKIVAPIYTDVGSVISAVSATGQSVNFTGSDEIAMSVALYKVDLSAGTASVVGSASDNFTADEFLTATASSLAETVASGFAYYLEISVDATISTAMDLRVLSGSVTMTSGVL